MYLARKSMMAHKSTKYIICTALTGNLKLLTDGILF